MRYIHYETYCRSDDPETEIKARIAELGRQINEHYKDSGSEMVLVGLLRGSFMFMADLCREFRYPMKWIS